LVEAGFDRAEVSDEVDRLAAVGLIDDDAFARALIDHQAGKRHAGVRALKRALITRGLSSETAERMIAALPDDDAARAEALAAEKVGRVRGLPTDKAYARLLGLLLRRGHSPDVARAAARRALEIDAGTGSA
jgi:regulatory protein